MLGNESILAVDYRIDGDLLYRYQAKEVERIVPWGPEADASRIVAGVWQPFIPEIDVCALEENAWRPDGTRWPGWRRRIAACRFLVERWPDEARDGVRQFPSGHWQLLQFVNAGGPPALELLHSNPALGYLAAMAGMAGQIGLRRRSLAALLGFPETEHAVRLLRKAPAAWISCEFLAQLRAAIAHEGDAATFLTHLARINPLVLELARDPQLRASVAPDCVARLSRMPGSAAHSDLIARMRELLGSAHSRAQHLRIRTLADLDRPLGAARVPAPSPARPVESFAFPETPPRNAAVPAAPPPPPIPRIPDLNQPVRIVQIPAPPPRIRPRQARTVDLAFPPPPLPDLATPEARISAIRSRADLIAEGNLMQHCAGRDKSYARRVAGGSLYFYRMLEPERLTIAIRPAGSCWVLEQMRGFRNRDPLEDSRMLVWIWLRQAAESQGEATCAAPAPAPALPAAVRPVMPRRPRRIAPPNQLSFDFTAIP